MLHRSRRRRRSRGSVPRRFSAALCCSRLRATDALVRAAQRDRAFLHVKCVWSSQGTTDEVRFFFLFSSALPVLQVLQLLKVGSLCLMREALHEDNIIYTEE